MLKRKLRFVILFVIVGFQQIYSQNSDLHPFLDVNNISWHQFSVGETGIQKITYQFLKKMGVPVISHCEECSLSKDGVINEGKYSKKFSLPGIPNSSEELGVLRDIFIAEYTKAHLHVCHVSTEGSVEIIRRAKKNGINVTCEATPHHFT